MCVQEGGQGLSRLLCSGWTQNAFNLLGGQVLIFRDGSGEGALSPQGCFADASARTGEGSRRPRPDTHVHTQAD